MKKILSVDDEPAILKCIKAALSARGYEVLTTDKPSQAIELIGKHDVDLVILDIRMPEISGFDVYQALKKRHMHAIPVLFATAHPGSFTMESDSIVEMWQEEFADGNTDIVYKPFDLSTLFEKVEGLIGPSEDAD